MEFSRAAMLRLYHDKITESEFASSPYFKTPYELPGKYTSAKTPLQRFLYKKKVWSIWTTFFFSFPILPHSPEIFKIPLSFPLKEYSPKMKESEKSKLDGENHAMKELEAFLFFPYQVALRKELQSSIEHPLDNSNPHSTSTSSPSAELLI
jgi:hypothetical protein